MLQVRLNLKTLKNCLLINVLKIVIFFIESKNFVQITSKIVKKIK